MYEICTLNKILVFEIIHNIMYRIFNWLPHGQWLNVILFFIFTPLSLRF